MILRVAWVVIFILGNAACYQHYLLRPISAIRTTTLSDADELMSELAEFYPTMTTTARRKKITIPAPKPTSTPTSTPKSMSKPTSKLTPKPTVPLILSTVNKDAGTVPSTDVNDENEDDDQQGGPQSGDGNREKEHRGKGGEKEKGGRGKTGNQRKPDKGTGNITTQSHRLSQINVPKNRTEGSTENDRGHTEDRHDPAATLASRSHSTKFNEWAEFLTTRGHDYSPHPSDEDRGRDSFPHEANKDNRAEVLTNSSNSAIRNEKFTEEIGSLMQIAKGLVDQYEQFNNLMITLIVILIILTIAGVGIVVWLLHMKFQQLYMAVEIVPETYEPRSLNIR